MCPSVLLETCLCEAYEGGLMGHFGVQKTLDTLKEHFYWPNMKKDKHKFCEHCIVCKKAKSKVMPHGLYRDGLEHVVVQHVSTLHNHS